MSLQSELKDLEDEVKAAEERASKAESEVPLFVCILIVLKTLNQKSSSLYRPFEIVSYHGSLSIICH